MRNSTTFKRLVKPLSTTLIDTSTLIHDSDAYYKVLNTRTHLLSMIYAQINGVQSLRGSSPKVAVNFHSPLNP